MATDPVNTTGGTGTTPTTGDGQADAQTTIQNFLTAFMIQVGQSAVLEGQTVDGRLERRRQEIKEETGET
jgi:hypothetical protein